MKVQIQGLNKVDPVKINSVIYSVPIGLSFIKLVLDRLNWPDTGMDVLSCIVEVSFDNGANWPISYGFTAKGGICLDKNGVELPYSFIQFQILEPDNVNRKIKCSFDIKEVLMLNAIWEFV